MHDYEIFLGGYLMMTVIDSVDDLTACEQKVTIMAVQRELTWATSHYHNIFKWNIFVPHIFIPHMSIYHIFYVIIHLYIILIM